MNVLKELIEKYDLNKQQIANGIDQLCKSGLGSICDTSCMLAFAELLTMLEYQASKGE